MYKKSGTTPAPLSIIETIQQLGISKQKGKKIAYLVGLLSRLYPKKAVDFFYPDDGSAMTSSRGRSKGVSGRGKVGGVSGRGKAGGVSSRAKR
jgi:hypothetical protein